MAAQAQNAPQITLAELTRRNSEGIEALTKSMTSVIDVLGKTRASNHPDPRGVFSAPNVRTGEDPMSSRGFSFMKMFGVLTGATPPEEAKIELDVSRRMHDCFVKNMSSGAQYNYGSRGRPGETTFLAPLATNFMPDSLVPANFRHEMKSLVNAGMDGADFGEMEWIRKKQLQQMGYGQKTLSWLTDTLGGALVAPPQMGELIELLRNKEALVNAGARVVPLPPQGRMKYPRQTGPGTAYWVGENAPITSSDIALGEITLQAKKLAILMKAPNELLRFASPAAEALMRDDMTKSLALALDLAGLEGQGGDNRPRGLLNMPNIYTLPSSDARATGDRLVGNDIYRMIAAVEEANAEFEGFVMRPKTLYKFYQMRSDAVSQGDGQGPFLFSLIREAAGEFPAALAGYPVTKSTQVSQVRSKGGSTNLTYIIGGRWSELLIGMFGAVEFAATTVGDTAFVNDQTWVRGILSADIQARHEAAFVLLDNLDLSL